uniref:Photosystem I reaction centre subunit XI PsaL n=1 Tax=Coelastrella TaxID=75800 RepID=UPI003003A6EA
MLETPVTSTPEVASYLSNLPAYRTGVAPLLRGVEIGRAHGFFLPGPFIKLGPLRNVEGAAEIAGCLSAAGLVIILAAALSIYGSAMFQGEPRDPLQSAEGWNEFTSGFTVGALSGVAWAFACT